MSDITAPALRHGGLGIASFAIAVAAIVILLLDIAVAGYLAILHQSTPAINYVVGIIMFLCWLLDIVSVALGVVGLRDKSSRNSFPIWGICVATGTFLFSAAFIAYGIQRLHHGGI